MNRINILAAIALSSISMTALAADDLSNFPTGNSTWVGSYDYTDCSGAKIHGDDGQLVLNGAVYYGPTTNPVASVIFTGNGSLKLPQLANAANTGAQAYAKGVTLTANQSYIDGVSSPYAVLLQANTGGSAFVDTTGYDATAKTLSASVSCSFMPYSISLNNFKQASN